VNKPVEVATLTGAEAVVEMLKLHGVETIFGLCGDTSLPLYDVLRSSALKHILTRDERRHSSSSVSI
jgi:acetolactate synthase-1/2/3 large subunit